MQVLDGHGYYEVIAASIGYVTPPGDESERLEKILEGFAFPLSSHTKGFSIVNLCHILPDQQTVNES